MHLIFIYSPGKLSIFIMCLAIPIYTFDSHRLKKNPLNGWGKGKNKQTPVLMQTLQSASRNSILTTVYKGQSSRSKGHRAGVTLQIKLRDQVWNLITGRIHSLFHPYHICNKGLHWGPRWVVGVSVSNFPTRTITR